jgi:hypothetical protein
MMSFSTPIRRVRFHQSEGPTGHVGTRRDSKWDTISPWMGHHFAKMGHNMGHHFDRWDTKWDTILPRWDTKWDTNGHHSAKMGHEGTPMDTILVSHVVMVKY